ncbi:hypothetical protein ACJMK2_038758 [Sinanodonta woodiana]|uniref:NTR domain-containing protein n=1 Tax=Sinanodonta woodiana TaxID=1069815 RepID=A0ABD3W9Z6_SINWO
MDRPVIFLQFLLMLVAAINALPRCKCGKHSKLKYAVCKDKTLIMAAPESARYTSYVGEPVDNPEDSYFTIYTMNLNTIYNEGYNRLGDASSFELVAATRVEDCGVKLELQTDYFIAGSALNETLLWVHSCNYVERVPWNEKTAEELEEMNDYLTRQTHVDCSKF